MKEAFGKIGEKVKNMSPDRQPSSDAGSIIELPTMVLSSVPVESGHIIMQDQRNRSSAHNQQPQQQLKKKQSETISNNISHNHNKNQQVTQSTATSISLITKSIASSQSLPVSSLPSAIITTTSNLPPSTIIMPSSKLLVLQQSHIGDGTTGARAYINGNDSTNIGGKIVLVATEQIDPGHHNGNIRTISTTNSNSDEELTSLTWLHEKNVLKGMNFTCPPNIKQMNNNNNNHNNHNNHNNNNNTNNGVKTVIESSNKQVPQTASSSAAVSPTSDFVDDSYVSEDNISSANSSSDQGISIYSTEASPISYHYTISTNNNNNMSNKNRNLINNINHQPPPASSIVHLSPGGSTVIEYKTSATNSVNKIQTTNYTNAVPLITTTTVATPMSATTKSLQANIINDLSNKNMGDNCTQSTPHQHFHKRYLREEHDKIMKQINKAAVESAVMTASVPASIINASTTTYTIPIKQHYSPTTYEHETVIVENEHPQTTTILQNHFEQIERSEDYITPGNSPRQHDNLHPPQAPQKSMFVTSATPPTTPGSLVSGQTSIETMSPTTATAAATTLQQNKQKHPNNLPYDPFIHTNNKPPLSFSSLIFLAIEDAKEKALPVKEIYSWIVQHYPYFKTAPTGWKNSVRHNLSLNKCFQKVEKAPNMGKGSLWRVEQQYKQNLIIALTRSSYHPNTAAMEKVAASYKTTPRSSESPPPVKQTNVRPLDAELFPRLSKFMANVNGNATEIVSTSPQHMSNDEEHKLRDITESYHKNGMSQNVANNVCIVTNNNNINNHTDSDVSVNGDFEPNQACVERIARDWGVDSIDDVNAATAMLALKHGPKVFAETFQSGVPIITSVPSEDHTYSAGGVGKRTNNITNNNNNNNSNINNNNLVIDSSNINISTQTNNIENSINNSSDNISNGTSSDAAYESSEESQNHITPEELARRHQEGVDAFLSFATEVSTMPSPIKRPPSPDYMENIPNRNFINNNNSQNFYHYNGDSSPPHQHQMQQHHVYSYLSSPSPPKKPRSRTLRTKLKKLR